jgi:chromosome partitioning protein
MGSQVELASTRNRRVPHLAASTARELAHPARSWGFSVHNGSGRATSIVIAQSKGGAGKTTLAAHLGVAFAELFHAVILIDTDRQGSLARWHQRREAREGGGGTRLTFIATTGWQLSSELLRRARENELLLIDTPPRVDAEVRAVIKCADLVVVPVQPSPVDVWATLSTLEMARSEQVPVLLVLNRVPARAALTSAMRQELARYDVGLASTSISNRVALAAAFSEGWGVTECAHGSSAEMEIVALAAELWGLLPSSLHETECDTEVMRPRADCIRYSSREERDGAVEGVIESRNASDALELVEPVTLTDDSRDNLIGHDSFLTREKLLSGIAFLKRKLTQSRR